MSEDSGNQCIFVTVNRKIILSVCSVVEAVISIMGHCSAVGVLLCSIHGQSLINNYSGHTCSLVATWSDRSI